MSYVSCSTEIYQERSLQQLRQQYWLHPTTKHTSALIKALERRQSIRIQHLMQDEEFNVLLEGKAGMQVSVLTVWTVSIEH